VPGDLEGHIELKKAITWVPIATGEHLHGRQAFRQLVENRAVDVSALSIVSGSNWLRAGENLNEMAGYGDKKVHRLQPDFIRAQAQCTAFYQKVVLATTETSASVNAMNYPLSSAERLMNAAGSRF